MNNTIMERLTKGQFVLIAEIGVNYYDIATKLNISLMEAAKFMVLSAKNAGIHAVKFQTYKAGTLAAKTMNHIRRDRKLKTSFSDFGEEAGGNICADKRFYELPMTEYRKSIEEIPTRKRANYRRRFVLLDEIDMAIKENMSKLIK